MRHANSSFRKLGRNASHRQALMRNMATSLILNESCKTTVQKAKDLRRVVEPLITLGKKGTLHARRQAASFLLNSDAVTKLFSDLSERFAKRNGGYLRIIKTTFRHGDAASLAIIELVEKAEKNAVEKKTKAKEGKSTKASSASDKDQEGVSKKKPAVKAKSKKSTAKKED
jgi:large subunit ribosomal protein L17